VWQWLESTTVAVAVRDSLTATALLSGLHLVGMVLATGAAIVRGVHWNDRALSRAVGVGLSISVTTGALLFLPRAAGAIENTFFRWKMLVLGAAVVGEFILSRRRSGATPAAPRLAATVLWAAVACLGCAYILLE
jgi:hypothetical protein